MTMTTPTSFKLPGSSLYQVKVVDFFGGGPVEKIRRGKNKVRGSDLAARIPEGPEPYFRERPVRLGISMREAW